MTAITTAPPAEAFRTDTVRQQPQRVDRQANVIYGASMMQVGDLNEGDARPWTVDMETLQQALSLAQQSRTGVKARFTHPNMSSDGMGSYLGRWANWRIEGETLRADLHIADAAFTSPQGDLGNYVMDLAEADPGAFGVSLAPRNDIANRQAFERRENPKPGDRWPIRMAALRAADVVDEPAATRGGLFSLDADLRNLPAQATALLNTYFGDAEPDVVRARIAGFLDRYFSTKGQPVAAIETQAPEVVTETPSAPAQPPADLSAAAAEIVTATPTADLAEAERTRCKKIRALCDLAGAGDKFNQFVDAGFSVEETQAALSQILVRRSTVLPATGDTTTADPHAAARAEYAEQKRLNMTFGMSEDEWIQHATKH